MNKKDFQELLRKQIIILDGATGSNLQKRGMPTGVCPELWILENKQVLISLQREYIAAGSQIIYAPTFSANRIKLMDYGLQERTKELNHALVKISQEAARGQALVAGDLTMTGAQLEPLGELTFAELIDVYKEQISCLAEAGADLLVVETMLSLQETRAAVLAARVVCDLPVMATLSFDENGRTMYGVSAAAAAVVLAGLGVDAFGMNCSSGPDKMLSVLEEVKKAAAIPIIVKPNAGMPRLGADGKTSYDMDRFEFAVQMKKMAAGGANLMGGCCGTAPEYIAEMKESIGAASALPVVPLPPERILLASERMVYSFQEGQILTIGREIDFSQHPELLEEYREDLYDTAVELAENAIEVTGVDIICLRADHPEVDEKEALLELLSEISRAVNMPCMIASNQIDTISYVLQNYSGIIAIEVDHNSQEWETQIKSIAKNYHAPLVTIDKKIIYC